jgi:murein DD-endopeptidase MepM/ murein hydrolase activator NlpD
MAAAFLFASGVAAALADSPPTTTTGETQTETTTTVPATTTAPTGATTTTPTATTFAPTTTTAPAATITTPAPAPTAAPRPATSPTSSFAPAKDCPIGALVIATPNAAPVVIGATATARARSARLSALVYPATGAIAKASTTSLAEQSCSRAKLGSARAQIRSLSLFGGAVTASAIDLTIGRRATSTITGLVVNRKHIAPRAGAKVPLPWGYVVVASRTPVKVTVAAGRRAIAAIAIYISRGHAGLPPGTTVLVDVAGMPATFAAQRKAARRRRKLAAHAPLRVKPPLGVRKLVFPVVGLAEYVDTYGAFRSDVPGNWHHGDDIFAPLGTPVVAVASGTINRVGWERLGGWRIWVRDSVGDEFYYAHLSGYAPTDLHSNHVTAGEVIGFIGNTGDAFTTSPHLHFEVHPRPLLHLGYDGAVDPTTYLNSWPHLRHARAPRPTHPPLPRQPLIRREAAYVFRELLAARHLIKRAPSVSTRPHVPIPAGANGMVANAAALPTRRAAGAARGTGTSSMLAIAFVAAVASLALLALTVPGSRRRLATLAPRLRARFGLKAPPPKR